MTQQKCPFTNEKIIQAAIKLGEAFANTKLREYQRPFAHRFVESVLIEDVATLTALFSRQCVHENTSIFPNYIKDIKKHDKINSSEGPTEVIDVEHSIKPCYEIDDIIATKDHLFKVAKFNINTEEYWDYIDSTLKVNDLLKYQFNTILHGSNEHAFFAAQLLTHGFKQDNILICEVPKYIETPVPFEDFHNKKVFKCRVNQDLLSWAKDNPKYIIQHLCDLATLKFTSGNRRVNNKKLYPELILKGTKKLEEFLTYFNISFKRKTDIHIKDFTSLVRLSPFLKHHSYYEKMMQYLDGYKQTSGFKVKPEDVKDIFVSNPRLKTWVSRSLLTHYRKNGMFLGTLIQLLHRIGEHEPNLRHVYKAIKKIHFVGEQKVVDIETTHGVFYGNNVEMHNSGKTESISVVSDALLLLFPDLALKYPKDHRFKKFRNGVWIGIFAPAKDQSRTTYERIKNRMESETGKQILQEFNVTGQVSNGDRVILSNGSILRCHTASDKANIESKTYHILIMEEAQDLSPYKIRKSILPMGADTAATVVMVGTANTQINDLYVQSEANKKNKKDGKAQDHFEVDYHEVIKYHPPYKKFVNKMKEKIGEESDEFKMSFCNIWCFERGMAFKQEELDPRTDTNKTGMLILNINILPFYTGHLPVVAGLDLGKVHDSTVFTPILIDTDNPIHTNMMTYYYKRILNWLEHLGDDYTDQIPSIARAIDHYKVQILAMDSTGPGQPIYDALSNMVDCEIIPINFNLPMKDLLAKTTQLEANAGRILVPSGDLTITNKQFKKWHTQCKQAIKEYKNGFLNFRKPHQKIDGVEPHDDFLVSMMLGLYAARKEEVQSTEMEMVDSPFDEQGTNEFLHG